MRRGLPAAILMLLVLMGASRIAFAQAAKSSLAGAVTDSGGGVIPGATVDVKNNATGVSTTTLTNPTGTFSVPSLDAGTYTVTVSLQGFKTAVVKDLVLIVGNPANVKVTLEVGNLSETVEVRGGSELIQTQATAVSSTINSTQIQNLPLTSRNVLLGFVTMLPGVDTVFSTSGTGAARDSTLFGLPEQSINITIDGINTQNNFQRDTDGFYSMVFPQLDAVEQVTLTGAAAGAQGAAGGGVSIQFVTRSGTNSYKGSGYHYFRHPDLNTNYYFNDINGLPKNRLILNQFGGNVGGPIRIPKVYDGTNSAFFFFNYEEFRQPTSATRTRTIMHPITQTGVFRYNVTTGGVTTVTPINLLQLAAANGQISTFDPTVVALLSQMRSLSEATVTSGVGVISDQNNVNTQQLLYQAPGNYVNHLPTSKVDFNLSTRHRLSGSYWWQEINRYPDIQNSGEAVIPGLPNVSDYVSHRTVGSISLRSTLSPNFVNELVTGWQWSPGTFNYGVVADQFQNQGGYSLGFPLGLSAATRSTNPNSRYQTNWSINETVNWLKGSHTMSFGGGFTRVLQSNISDTVVPSIAFGVQSGLDPADGMFNTTNFPGASNNNLTDARALYAFLTGRVVGVNATSRLNDETGTYQYLGTERLAAQMDEYSLFLQDSWRLRPTLTLNMGVAWVAQMPLSAGNGVLSTTDYAGFCGPYGIGANGKCNLFQVGGPQTGVTPQFVEYTAGTKGYNTDWNNVAPNVGVAWQPTVRTGWARTILGDPDQATLRAGYSIAFDRPSMGTFLGVYQNNPGRSINTNRNNNTGSNYLLVGPGETWPVLYRDPSRLGPPAGIPEAPVYPIAATTGSSLAIFDADIQVPYAHSFSAGLQRSLGTNMALEVRYVGTRGRNAWVTENWNETNLIENNFFNEFKLAQQNLRSAVNAGLCATAATCTFGYRGPGTGTSPLPTFLAYLTGVSPAQAGDPAQYSTATALTGFTNTTLLGRLNMYQPGVANMAGDLQTTARIANALAAGLPSNFFRMNPAIGTNNDNLTTGVGQSRYDSIVLDLRRRLSQGLLVTASYTRTWRWGQARDTLHYPRFFVRSTNEVPHALKLTSSWELPVGRGKRFGANLNPWLNGVIGDWAFNMTGRVQAGEVLTQTGIKLVGMSEKDLQKEFKTRIVDTIDSNGNPTKIIYMLPDDIILNTRRAFSTSATTANGYGSLGFPEGRYIAPASGPDCVQLYPGDCGPRNIYLSGPVFTRFDTSFKKTIPIAGRVNFQLQLDVLNIFGAINFSPVFNPGSGGGIFQVDEAYTDISGTYDPGGRLMQVVWRINW